MTTPAIVWFRNTRLQRPHRIVTITADTTDSAPALDRAIRVARKFNEELQYQQRYSPEGPCFFATEGHQHVKTQ